MVCLMPTFKLQNLGSKESLGVKFQDSIYAPNYA